MVLGKDGETTDTGEDIIEGKGPRGEICPNYIIYLNTF